RSDIFHPKPQFGASYEGASHLSPRAEQLMIEGDLTGIGREMREKNKGVGSVLADTDDVELRQVPEYRKIQELKSGVRRRWRSLLLFRGDLVQINYVAAGLGKIFVHGLGLPPRNHVVVGDNARARFQVFLQVRPQDLVGIGGQIDRHDVGGAQIDLKQVSAHHSRIVLQAELLNSLSGASN